jgi:hypothetical protein
VLMTQSDAGSNRGQRAKLLAGRASCTVGLLLAIGQVLYTLFLNGGANTSAGILGIAFCILGYYLDCRKPATAIIVLCTASVLFGLATSQGIL